MHQKSARNIVKRFQVQQKKSIAEVLDPLEFLELFKDLDTEELFDATFQPENQLSRPLLTKNPDWLIFDQLNFPSQLQILNAAILGKVYQFYFKESKPGEEETVKFNKKPKKQDLGFLKNIKDSIPWVVNHVLDTEYERQNMAPRLASRLFFDARNPRQLTEEELSEAISRSFNPSQGPQPLNQGDDIDEGLGGYQLEYNAENFPAHMEEHIRELIAEAQALSASNKSSMMRLSSLAEQDKAGRQVHLLKDKMVENEYLDLMDSQINSEYEDKVEKVKAAIDLAKKCQIEHREAKMVAKYTPSRRKSKKTKNSQKDLKQALESFKETLGDLSVSKNCQICNQSYSSKRNPIIYCSVCGAGFHMLCYGFDYPPEGDEWVCDLCTRNKLLGPVFGCSMCPNHGGSLKELKTDHLRVFGEVDSLDLSLREEEERWAHISCLSEKLKNEAEEKMTNLKKRLRKLPRGLKKEKETEDDENSEKEEKRVCIICSQSSGFLIKCKDPYCDKWFHVECARRANLPRRPYLSLKLKSKQQVSRLRKSVGSQLRDQFRSYETPQLWFNVNEDSLDLLSSYYCLEHGQSLPSSKITQSRQLNQKMINRAYIGLLDDLLEQAEAHMDDSDLITSNYVKRRKARIRKGRRFEELAEKSEKAILGSRKPKNDISVNSSLKGLLKQQKDPIKTCRAVNPHEANKSSENRKSLHYGHMIRSPRPLTSQEHQDSPKSELRESQSSLVSYSSDCSPAPIKKQITDLGIVYRKEAGLEATHSNHLCIAMTERSQINTAGSSKYQSERDFGSSLSTAEIKNRSYEVESVHEKAVDNQDQVNYYRSAKSVQLEGDSKGSLSICIPPFRPLKKNLLGGGLPMSRISVKKKRTKRIKDQNKREHSALQPKSAFPKAISLISSTPSFKRKKGGLSTRKAIQKRTSKLPAQRKQKKKRYRGAKAKKQKKVESEEGNTLDEIMEKKMLERQRKTRSRVENVENGLKLAQNQQIKAKKIAVKNAKKTTRTMQNKRKIEVSSLKIFPMSKSIQRKTPIPKTPTNSKRRRSRSPGRINKALPAFEAQNKVTFLIFDNKNNPRNFTLEFSKITINGPYLELLITGCINALNMYTIKSHYPESKPPYSGFAQVTLSDLIPHSRNFESKFGPFTRELIDSLLVFTKGSGLSKTELIRKISELKRNSLGSV